MRGPTPEPGPGTASWRAARWTTGRGVPLLTGASVLAAVAYLAVTDPYRPGAHLVCPVLALTGWYCAGCGAQRAVHSLAHGDLVAAWGMNPLLVVLAPVAVVAWLRWLAHAGRPDLSSGAGARGRAAARAPAGSGSGRVAWLLLTVVVLFAVGRNLPFLAAWPAP